MPNLRLVLGFIALICAISCAKSETTYAPIAPKPRPSPTEPPVGEWQKGTTSVLRASFQGKRSLPLTDFYAKTAPQCDRVSRLPEVLQLQSRLVTYRRFPFSRTEKADFEEQLSVNDITALADTSFRMRTSMWRKTANATDTAVFTGDVEVSKVLADSASGKYAAESFWGEVTVNNSAVFSVVEGSPILLALKEEAEDESVSSGEWYAEGEFTFGNGDRAPALMRKKIIRPSHTELLAEIEIRLVDVPGLYDVNCVAATAFQAVLKYSADEPYNEEETELLFHSATTKTPQGNQ